MKGYDIILPSIKRGLKNHSKEYVMGYIDSLWDWLVINLETHNNLEDFINKGVIE